MMPRKFFITHPEDKRLGLLPSTSNQRPARYEGFNLPGEDQETIFLVISKHATDSQLLKLAERFDYLKASLTELFQYRDSLPKRETPYSDEGIDTVEIPMIGAAHT